MNKEERRQINRVNFKSNSVIVVCETGEKYFVETKDISPLGMGITAKDDLPDITNKDIIIVTETIIMYADVTRQEAAGNGTVTIGIKAKKFTPDVMEYLMKHIA